MKPIKSIIIEGVDRLGKDTLINNIMNKLGFFQTVHFQKPSLLEAYVDDVKQFYGEDFSKSKAGVNQALELYQRRSFSMMLDMLGSPARFIFNRAHLGEVVYSHYREYDGSYVFDLEKKAIEAGSDFHETTLLILLHTSDFSFIKDDGLSFDFQKKEEEQDKFIWAFERSKIKYKMMVDVACNQQFVPANVISRTVTQMIETFPTLEKHFATVRWEQNGDEFERKLDLQIDPQNVF